MTKKAQYLQRLMTDVGGQYEAWHEAGDVPPDQCQAAFDRLLLAHPIAHWIGLRPGMSSEQIWAIITQIGVRDDAFRMEYNRRRQSGEANLEAARQAQDEARAEWQVWTEAADRRRRLIVASSVAPSPN